MAAVLFGTVAAACTLNSTGMEQEQGSPAPVMPEQGGQGGQGGEDTGDTSTDAPSEPPICSGKPGDCKDPVPEGWLRVGYVGDHSAFCPPGFDEIDVRADPIVPADACSCDQCEITSEPSCTEGEVTTYFGDNGACGTAGLVLANANPGQCTQLGTNGGTLSKNFMATPPPPKGGTCSLKATLDDAKIDWVEGRMCVPTSEPCAMELCQGGGMYAECLLRDGDNDCPPAFPTKRPVLGDNHGVTCGECSCAVEATCTGKLEVFTDSNCSSGKLTLDVDDSCADVGAVDTYHRYKYIGSVKSAECAGSATPGSVQVARTLCCK